MVLCIMQITTCDPMDPMYRISSLLGRAFLSEERFLKFQCVIAVHHQNPTQRVLGWVFFVFVFITVLMGLMASTTYVHSLFLAQDEMFSTLICIKLQPKCSYHIYMIDYPKKRYSCP